MSGIRHTFLAELLRYTLAPLLTIQQYALVESVRETLMSDDQAATSADSGSAQSPGSVQDSDSTQSLDSAGRALVHDIATPLATLQLNLQVLSTYLPAVLSYCENQAKLPSVDKLQVLAGLPAALDADIHKIRQAIQGFSSILVRQAQSVPRANPEQKLAAGRVRKILLVEDELIHQEIARKQLGNDYELSIASSVTEALELYSAQSFDLILLDLVVPGMDAKSFARSLRAGSHRIPVILVSNMPLAPDELEELGVDGALDKPFSKAKLVELLEQLAPASYSEE